MGGGEGGVVIEMRKGRGRSTCSVTTFFNRRPRRHSLTSLAQVESGSISQVLGLMVGDVIVAIDDQYLAHAQPPLDENGVSRTSARVCSPHARSRSPHCP